MHGEAVLLKEGGLTGGRDASNDLHPADLSPSRRHCAFRIENGHVTLSDLDSMNGTFVNGVPVKTRVLAHGDQLKIGESTFLFMQPDAASPALGGAGDAPAIPTLQLKREDVLYVQSDQMITAFSPALRQERTFEALLRFGRALASAIGAEEVHRAVIDSVLELVPAEHAAIVMSETGK